MKNIDVVIVGGGPAGISLAYILHQKKISCCIVDKAVFPREKLCGGLVTQKTVDIYRKIYGDSEMPYKVKTDVVGLYFQHKCVNKVKTDYPFLLVNRFDFDYNLVTRYKKCGGIIYEGVTICEINTEINYIKLSNGEEITYKYLVGADGANSVIRKYVDKKYRPDGLCMEINKECAIKDKEIQLHFGVLNKGYGWIFPKNDTLTIGYGGVINANKNIAKGFDNYLSDCNLEIREKAKGFPLTFGTYVKKPYNGNIFLIGDAAGLTDPVTGEGLYYAFLSAYVLANSLDLKNPLKSGLNYYQSVKKLQKTIKSVRRMRNFFFKPMIMRWAMKIFMKHPNTIKFTCDNAISFYRIPFSKLPFEYYKIKKGK